MQDLHCYGRKKMYIKPTSYYNMLGSGNARFLSMILMLIILFQEEFNACKK
jgi:hypothetical protein